MTLFTYRYKGAFRHPSFHRDRPENVVAIRRKPPSNSYENQTAPKSKLSKRQAAKVQAQAPQKNLPQPQVLSPNKPIKKKSTLSMHLPPKKRIFPREEVDVENEPIFNEVKEKFKSVVGKRPTMGWSS